MVPFTGISFTAVADIPYRHDRSLLFRFSFFQDRQPEEPFKILSNVQGLRRSVFNSSECHHVLLDARGVKNLAFLSQLSN